MGGEGGWQWGALDWGAAVPNLLFGSSRAPSAGPGCLFPTSRDTEVLLGSLGAHSSGRSLCRLGCHGKEPRLVNGYRDMTFHKIMGLFRLENPSNSSNP